MCGKEKNGLPVKEDVIIQSLRWVKRNITKNPKNFTLVVCKDDFLVYKKKRDSYERKMVMYVAIGIIFLAALAAVSSQRLGAVGVGLLITLFLLLLAQLSYMPAVEMPAIKEKKQKK